MLYTFILSVMIYREVKWSEVPKVLLDSAATTSIVLLLVATSMAMSWVLSCEHIPETVSLTLVSMSDNPVVILLVINVLLLAVGTFMT